jgi:hypothetical protein
MSAAVCHPGSAVSAEILIPMQDAPDETGLIHVNTRSSCTHHVKVIIITHL